jgi:hypothetical protein
MVKALKREVYKEIVGGGPAGSTAGTLLANRDANIAVFEKEKFPRFTIGESLPPTVRGDYVLSSYEADVVKPLMHFSSIGGCRGWHDPAGASLKRNPKGFGVTLLALDLTWRVLTRRDDTKSVVVRETSATTLVMHGATDDAAACQTALKGWLTHKAEEHLIPWLKRVSDETGLSYSAVSIRQQQTRWGSCSSRHLISLNARLLFLSPDLVTYVLVHELCHTKHLNHSPRFWRLAESYLPDYRHLDRQLRNGSRWVPGWLTVSCGAKFGKLGVGRQANQMQSSAFI